MQVGNAGIFCFLSFFLWYPSTLNCKRGIPKTIQNFMRHWEACLVIRTAVEDRLNEILKCKANYLRLVDYMHNVAMLTNRKTKDVKQIPATFKIGIL